MRGWVSICIILYIIKVKSNFKIKHAILRYVRTKRSVAEKESADLRLRLSQVRSQIAFLTIKKGGVEKNDDTRENQKKDKAIEEAIQITGRVRDKSTNALREKNEDLRTLLLRSEAELSFLARQRIVEASNRSHEDDDDDDGDGNGHETTEIASPANG